MDSLTAIVLGIVQGITEFIPISSSGHLVILQNLFGVEEGAITFNIFVHFGTVIAVIIIYHQDILEILFLKEKQRRMTVLLIAGLIPTAIIGILFEEQFKALFTSTVLVGFMLLITGTILYLGERLAGEDKDIKRVTIGHALLIGLAQSFAIFPGISRSGATIVMALILGLKRELAARYSFLLAVPVIIGATLLEARALFHTPDLHFFIPPLILGTLFSILAGYFAIKALLRVLSSRKLNYFSYYCWLVGLIIILTQI